VVLAATSISYVLVLLDTSIVNVALQSIADSFTTSISGLQWIMNAYTLTFASLLLTGGTLGDRFGAKRVYSLGLVVFTVATVLCGVAPGPGVLIAARALQGVGAALLVPCSLTLINNSCPDPHQKAKAMGFWIGCGGAAMAAGPVVGGILIHLIGWRAIFLVSVPISLVGIWLTQRIVEEGRASEVRHLDPMGQTTAFLGLAAIIAVLIEGPTLGWQSTEILGGIALGVVSMVVFLIVESRRLHPMLPLKFFESRLFSGSVFVSMASAFIFYGLLFLLSLYFQRIKGYSPLMAGLSFLPLTAVMAFGSMSSGTLLRRYGLRLPMCVAFGFYAMGCLILLFSSPTSPYWLAAMPMPLIGLASGFISPAATAPAMGTIDKARAGVAGGVLNTARQTGAALGVALFGTLLAAMHSFEAGMRSSVCIAAGMAVVATVIWWRLPLQIQPVVSPPVDMAPAERLSAL